MSKDMPVAPSEPVENAIRLIRRQRVILDNDLALLYGVPTKVLNQAVKRNADRFPSDFLFQLTTEESAALRSQIVTLDKGRGRHRKYVPYAFTEHGAIMAANVLNSPRAVQASVFVVRAFVRMREALTAHRDLAEKLAELERKVSTHDTAIREIVETIRQLTVLPEEPEEEKPKIGFHVRERAVRYQRRRTAASPPSV